MNDKFDFLYLTIKNRVCNTKETCVFWVSELKSMRSKTIKWKLRRMPGLMERKDPILDDIEEL